ncbi:hypothetical protein QQP08_014994 [Theobroma cacao]|nr:hypothetical protein QQP08_014994 [Theobroma cacao]
MTVLSSLGACGFSLKNINTPKGHSEVFIKFPLRGIRPPFSGNEEKLSLLMTMKIMKLHHWRPKTLIRSNELQNFHAGISQNSNSSSQWSLLDRGPCKNFKDVVTGHAKDQFAVRASSDGLILCLPRFAPKYFVCNPLTRQWEAIPIPANIDLYSLEEFWDEGLRRMVPGPYNNDSLIGIEIALHVVVIFRAELWKLAVSSNDLCPIAGQFSSLCDPLGQQQFLLSHLKTTGHL